MAGNCLDRARWGARIKCEYHAVLDYHSALNKCLNGVFLWAQLCGLTDL